MSAVCPDIFERRLSFAAVSPRVDARARRNAPELQDVEKLISGRGHVANNLPILHRGPTLF